MLDNSQGNGDWVYVDQDGDTTADVAVIDRDLDGCNEEAWFDINNNGVWEAHLYNSYGDGCFLEVLTFDENENGYIEEWVADYDQVVGFDVAYADGNEDGVYESSWTQPGTLESLVGPNIATVGNPTYDNEFSICTVAPGCF